MGVFDNDEFEDVIREFFGQSQPQRKQSGKKKSIENEEDRGIDFVDDKNNTYLIFDLPGFKDHDVDVTIKSGEIDIIAQKKDGEGVQSYMKDKLVKGIRIKKDLPNFVSSKKFDYTMKNGVLEVKIEKS